MKSLARNDQFHTIDSIDNSVDDQNNNSIFDFDLNSLPEDIQQFYNNNSKHFISIDIDSIDIVKVYEQTNKYKFLVKDRLGKGVFGSAYKAIESNSTDQSEVAIKIVKCGDDCITYDNHLEESLFIYFIHINHSNINFLVEILKRLVGRPHPNVIRLLANCVYNVDLNDLRLYSVLELSPIGDLLQLIVGNKVDQDHPTWTPISESSAKHVIEGVAKGVKHLFSCRVAHCDIKPQNILMFWTDKANVHDYSIDRIPQMTPKLTDFNNSHKWEREYTGFNVTLY